MKKIFKIREEQLNVTTDMDLSSPGGRGASRKSRSSSSVGSQNHQITDSFSSLEPWHEGHDDFDPADVVKSGGAALRGAASLPHIVKEGCSDFVLSKSESAVVNLGKSEQLVDGAGALPSSDDGGNEEDDSDVILRHPVHDSHPRLLYDEMSPSLGSVVDSPLPPLPHGAKSYDYLLKFLLVSLFIDFAILLRKDV